MNARKLNDAPDDLTAAGAVIDFIIDATVPEDRADLYEAVVDPSFKGEDLGALYGWLVGEYHAKRRGEVAAEKRRLRARKNRDVAARFGEVA